MDSPSRKETSACANTVSSTVLMWAGGVAHGDPDNPGWGPVDVEEVQKIAVLGHDHGTGFARGCENGFIGCVAVAKPADRVDLDAESFVKPGGKVG